MSLYIGVADQRLYRIVGHTLPHDQNVNRIVQRLETQLAADFGRPGITRDRQYDKWLAVLTPDRQAAMEREFDKRIWPLYVPWVSQWFEDYKELSPGRWMPMSMGYDIWNMDSPSFIRGTRNRRWFRSWWTSRWRMTSSRCR